MIVVPSKLTLSLRVLGMRADGFHDLEALTVAIGEPHDALTIEAAERTTIAVTGPFASGVPVDATNLAVRAADLAGVTVAITLHKGIPNGAGLGGGSADAAAVLVALGRPDLAADLGSDVPFCVHGDAAWMRGRGEILEPATVPALDIVIAVPPFGCSTPAVYRAWDELGGPTGRTIDTGVEGLPPLGNDLEPAAEHVEPRLAAFRRAVEEAAGRPALLAGSGSAYAVIASGDADLHTRVERAVEGAVYAASYLPC